MTKMELRKKLRKELSRAKSEITTIIATVLLYYGLLLGLYGFAIFYHFIGEWFYFGWYNFGHPLFDYEKGMHCNRI